MVFCISFWCRVKSTYAVWSWRLLCGPTCDEWKILRVFEQVLGYLRTYGWVDIESVESGEKAYLP